MNTLYVYISGLHTGFFYGGGTHISAASRGLVACSPRKFFVFYIGLSPNSGGGNSS